MRLLGISCDAQGIEIGALEVDQNGQAGAFASKRVQGQASISDIAVPLVDEVLLQWAACLGQKQSSAVERPKMQAIVFNAGPGGFTSVRAACGLAQGLAFGWQVPVLGVSSLQAWANSAKPASRRTILTLIDARIAEVYAGLFDSSDSAQLRQLGEDMVLKPEAINAWLNQMGVRPQEISIIGDVSVVDLPSQVLPLRHKIEQCLPGASFVDALHIDMQAMMLSAARLGIEHFGDAAHAQPRYVRNKVALNVQEQQALRSVA